MEAHANTVNIKMIHRCAVMKIALFVFDRLLKPVSQLKSQGKVMWNAANNRFSVAPIARRIRLILTMLFELAMI